MGQLKMSLKINVFVIYGQEAIAPLDYTLSYHCNCLFFIVNGIFFNILIKICMKFEYVRKRKILIYVYAK
jgi:hypothetical protein